MEQGQEPRAGQLTHRVACLLLSGQVPQPALEALAEACLRFSPQIAIRAGEAIFMDVQGETKTLPLKLLALAERLYTNQGSHQARVAIAHDAPTALAMARFFGISSFSTRQQPHTQPHQAGESFSPARELSSEKSWRELPLQALRDYLDPFEADADQLRKLERTIGLLRVLGVKTLGEFAALPSASLAARLGKHAVELSARVQGKLPVAWPGFRPVPKVREEAAEGGENLEAILFVLKGVLDRAMARLRGRAERAIAIEVGVKLESWSVVGALGGKLTGGNQRHWRFEFPMPQGSALGILPILRERLNFELERDPLKAPVEGCWIEVLETAPGRAAQRDFFSRKEEQDEAFESLVARLTQRLGKDQAFIAQPVARFLPEKAYVRTLEPSEGEKGGDFRQAWPERPARLLAEPERLEFRGKTLIHRGKGLSWEITGYEGPERISGEWWKGEFDRDYYRMVSEKGETLWVFKDRRAESFLYLHGFFD